MRYFTKYITSFRDIIEIEYLILYLSYRAYSEYLIEIIIDILIL